MTPSSRDSGPQTSPHGDRLRAARIGKPHGIRGEVTVELFTDEPEQRLAPGQVLHREPGPDTAERTLSELTVTSQRWNKKICLLGFAEVSDRNHAEALRGSVLSVTAAPATDDDDGWYSHELEGLSCRLADGTVLGVVVELVTGPAQDLLVVRTASSEEIMVPFVEELVPEVDVASGVVIMNPPPGLFPDGAAPTSGA